MKLASTISVFVKLAFVILTLAATSLVTLAAENADRHKSANPVTVHEWGTFTSVADPDGNPMSWAPLNGKPDLPCFVFGLERQRFKFLPGKIRMETPVLYFYASQPSTLDVRVDFPQGRITEWYPHATSVSGGTADASSYRNGQMVWNNVQVLPGKDLTFPMGESPTHYYTARETDAAPLRIGDQQEKMIFYRGVGSFDPALRPRFTEDGRIELRNAGDLPITAAIVFENRDNRVGYRTVRDLRETVVVDSPELTGDPAALRASMQQQLESMGMFPKEAAAMVETWRDSWFEEGTRVFYFLPQADVDRDLPLTISPAPAAIARAFVGRVEMLSPATRNRIRAALATEDRAAIERLGRFLDSFARTMNLRVPEWARWEPEGPGCIE